MDQGKLSKELPVHQILSDPVSKVPIIKEKRICYDDDEEEEPSVSHRNQGKTVSVPPEKDKEPPDEKGELELWGDDIDESCLAGILDDTTMLPTTVTQHQSETGERSETRESDAWGAEEDWLTENNELEKSLVEIETEALHKGSPSFKKKILVKRKPICYDSDEESSTTVESGFTSRHEMTREGKLIKECNRKKRLKMLLS